jgi:serine/threonine protein kinase
MYSTNNHLQKKIQHEFEILQKLGFHPDIRIPRAYFLSSQWNCGGSHKCQFLVMTKTGPDFDRLVTRNTFGLSKAVQRGKPGQFELFVASVGLCVIVELEKLHRAGGIHGDIGRYNVAKDLNDSHEVVLIDFGQGKLKSELSDSEFRRSVQRDYRRTNAFILRLLKTKLGIDYEWSSEGNFRSNPLFALVDKLFNDERDLKKTLMDFIQHEYGKPFSGKIMI